MSKHPSYNSRMNKAINEAALLHDGAYNDPMALNMISKNYKVNLKEFLKLLLPEVKERLRQEKEYD